MYDGEAVLCERESSSQRATVFEGMGVDDFRMVSGDLSSSMSWLNIVRRRLNTLSEPVVEVSTPLFLFFIFLFYFLY